MSPAWIAPSTFLVDVQGGCRCRRAVSTTSLSFPSAMHRFSRFSPSATPTRLNSPPPTPISSIEPIKNLKEIVRSHSRSKNPGVLAASASSIALSIASPSFNPSDTGTDESQSSRESDWRTVYGAARMALEIAKESSDMFLPLKAVVGALTVLIKNYDVSSRPSRLNLTLTVFTANRC